MASSVRGFVGLMAVGVVVAAVGARLGADCHSELTLLAESTSRAREPVEFSELAPQLRPLVAEAIRNESAVLPETIVSEVPRFVRADGGTYELQFYRTACRYDEAWFVVVFVGVVGAVVGMAGVLQAYLGDFHVRLGGR